MATEEQKKERMQRLYNSVIFGFARGLYDLFEEASQATVTKIGNGILSTMENELGLEVAGEDPKDMLTEISRLLVDEYGMVKDSTIDINGDTIHIFCEGCRLWNVTMDLKAADIPPFTCVPMMMARAALRERLGRKARFINIEHDNEKHTCEINLELL